MEGVVEQSGLIPLRRYLYRLIAKYLSYFMPADASVLEVGARTRLLMDALATRRTAAYRPSSAAGFSPAERVDTFTTAALFEPDRVVLNGTLHVERDIQALLDETVAFWRS